MLCSSFYAFQDLFCAVFLTACETESLRVIVFANRKYKKSKRSKQRIQQCLWLVEQGFCGYCVLNRCKIEFSFLSYQRRNQIGWNRGKCNCMFTKINAFRPRHHHYSYNWIKWNALMPTKLNYCEISCLHHLYLLFPSPYQKRENLWIFFMLFSVCHLYFTVKDQNTNPKYRIEHNKLARLHQWTWWYRYFKWNRCAFISLHHVYIPPTQEPTANAHTLLSQLTHTVGCQRHHINKIFSSTEWKNHFRSLSSTCICFFVAAAKRMNSMYIFTFLLCSHYHFHVEELFYQWLWCWIQLNCIHNIITLHTYFCSLSIFFHQSDRL